LWHSESAWHYDVDVAYQHRSDWTRLQWALQQQMSPFSPLEVATRPLLKRLSLLMLTVRGERSKSGIKSENVWYWSTALNNSHKIGFSQRLKLDHCAYKLEYSVSYPIIFSFKKVLPLPLLPRYRWGNDVMPVLSLVRPHVMNKLQISMIIPLPASVFSYQRVL